MRKVVAFCGVVLIGSVFATAQAEEPEGALEPETDPSELQASASVTGPGTVALDTMFVAKKVLKSIRVRYRDKRRCFDECQKHPECDGVMVPMKSANVSVACLLVSDVSKKAVKGWLAWTPVARCARHGDCRDGKFCNGDERCDWQTGSLRCVKGKYPCSKGQVCNEGQSRCEQPCNDADGDGFKSASCGFDDCNDADGTIYPGHHEACDAKDNDCDPCSVGNTDADGDGFVSAGCSNPVKTAYIPSCGGNPKVHVDAAKKIVRGRDCDDANPALKPGSMKCDPDASYTQICTNGAWVRHACSSGTKCKSQPDGTGLCLP